MSKSAAGATISPAKAFTVNYGLVGLDFDISSERLLQYLSFLAKEKIKFDFCHFLHVAAEDQLFHQEMDATFRSLSLEQSDDLSTRLQEMVSNAFPEPYPFKMKVEVVTGNPLTELLKTAKTEKSDLVIIGQNSEKGSHGILARNFCRQVKCNAMVIPSKSKPSMKRILVPVDFSEHSAKALKAAVAIGKDHEKPPRVTVMHNYQLPGNYGAYRYSQIKVLEMIEEDRRKVLNEFIEEHVADEDRRRIQPALVQCNYHTVGQHIHDFATSHKAHLIVMGAKGHSKLELLFLGSVTEKVLSLTTKIPVLIIR